MILNYIKPSCIIFCVKMSRYSQVLYCLQKETNFELKNSNKKNPQYPQGFWDYIKSSCIIFCAKISGYSQTLYCLQEESANFGTKDIELNQVFICPKMS